MNRKAIDDHTDQFEPSRRGFLTKLWIGLGVVALIELIGVVIVYLRPRRFRANTADREAVFEAGAVEAFQPNSVTAFVRAKLYLCRLEAKDREGRVSATTAPIVVGVKLD